MDNNVKFAWNGINDSLCQIKVIETDPPIKSTPTPCR